VSLGDKIILTLTNPDRVVKSVKMYRGSSEWRYDTNKNIGWTVTYTGVSVVLAPFSGQQWGNADIPSPDQVYFWLDDTASLDALWGQMDAAGLVHIASFD
jgi:hypothetical protein